MLIIVGIVFFSIGVSDGIVCLVIEVGNVVVVGRIVGSGVVLVWLFRWVLMLVVMKLLKVVVIVSVSRVGSGCMGVGLLVWVGLFGFMVK